MIDMVEHKGPSAQRQGGERNMNGLKRTRSNEKCLPEHTQRPKLNGCSHAGQNDTQGVTQRRTRHQLRKLGTDIDDSGNANRVDLTELIEKASGCSMIDQIEKVLEDTWPPARGNNMSVQLLKETYRALDLGLYTNRKMAIPGMAMMLWLLAGKLGEDAAYESACVVKNATLPNGLKTLIDARGSIKLDGKVVLNKWLGPAVNKPKLESKNDITSGNEGGDAKKQLLKKYSEDFIQLASVGRMVMGINAGDKITFAKLFKTEFLANQEISFFSRKTRIKKDAIINETGSGVICKCQGCSQAPNVNVMSPKDFLAHVNAKPTEILEYLKLKEHNQSFRNLVTLLSSDVLAQITTDVYPDHCFKCKLGGNLLCCDGCTTAWHIDCTSLDSMPPDDTPWLCPLCEKDGRVLKKGLVENRRKIQRIMNQANENKSKKGKGRKVQGGYKPKPGGRVRMMAPERHGRPVRNLNRNKRLFEGEKGGLISGMRVFYRARGENIIGGYIVINPSGQSGIRCDCCDRIISCSQFESHAGHAQRRQPYEHIYVEEEGINLKKIAARLPERSEGGPGGDDAHDIYTDLDALTGGCIFCREPDFQKGEFGSRTIMICDQCEREYHVGCLADNGLEKLESLPEGDWFCDDICGQIHGHFKSLVASGEMNVDILMSDEPQTAKMLLDAPLQDGPHSVEEEEEEDAVNGMRRSSRACVITPKSTIKDSPYKLDLESYTWQILNGSDGTEQTDLAIEAATKILQESFDPIMDLSTNTDLLPLMINAEQHGEWDYRGVHTLLLKYMDTPVVAAIVRAFGPQMAELPLIATSKSQRRRGHAKVLVDLYQKHLHLAGVHRLVLPAAHETVAAWKGGFHFEDMPHDDVRLAKHQLKVLVFPGTEMLWKTIAGIGPPSGHHVLKQILTEEEENDLIYVARSMVNKIEKEFELLAKSRVILTLMVERGRVNIKFDIEIPEST